MTLAPTLSTGVAPPAAPEASPGGLGLLAEPVAILEELRPLASERPATARSRAPQVLAAYACMTWQDGLSSAGISSGVVAQSFECCRREIWLWVKGDRRWSQLSPHLSAKVLRRAHIV